MRIYIILLFTIMISYVSAQSKKRKDDIRQPLLIDYAYIKIGETREHFADWAKRIEKWWPINVMGNPKLNDWWDQYYDLQGEKIIIDRTPQKINYRYIFKDDFCIQMEVTPISYIDYEKEISNHFEFIDVKEMSGQIKYNYRSKDGRYRLTVIEIITDTGFEKKTKFSKVLVSLN